MVFGFFFFFLSVGAYCIRHVYSCGLVYVFNIFSYLSKKKKEKRKTISLIIHQVITYIILELKRERRKLSIHV